MIAFELTNIGCKLFFKGVRAKNTFGSKNEIFQETGYSKFAQNIDKCMVKRKTHSKSSVFTIMTS